MGAFVVAVLAVSAATEAASPDTVTTWVPKRTCAGAKPGHATCFAMQLVQKRVSATRASRLPRRATVARPHLATGLAGGYTPADLATAYGVNPTGSASQTVAIVDAYDDPNVLAELNTFDAQYGIKPDGVHTNETTTSFKVVNQTGAATPLPAGNAGWAGEIALDVQAVRGLCHACKIVLVEGMSNSFDDLATAANTAASLAKIVSNSYGGNESAASFTAADAAKYDHNGVAILASTGDDGWYGWDKINPTHSGTGDQQSQVPASLGSVVGVAGTSLYLNDNATRQAELVWNENGPRDAFGWPERTRIGASGGGCSVLSNAQGWQKSVAGYNTLGCATNRRSSTDIAAIADPFTGYDIYRSYGVTPAWYTYGGTSLASPVVAALWALAGGPGTVKYPALSLYGHFKSDTTKHLYDVTLGGTGSCNTSTLASCANWWAGSTTGNPNLAGWGKVDCAWDSSTPGPTTPLANRFQCYAQKGYDGVSGVGTPMGTTAFTPMFPIVVIAAPTTVTHGLSATFSAARSSDPFPGGSITPGAANVKYVWNWGDGSVSTVTNAATASHTYAAAARSRTVKLYITDNYGQTGNKSITFVVH